MVSSTTAVNSHLSCKKVKGVLTGPQLGSCLRMKCLKEQGDKLKVSKDWLTGCYHNF
jgi:hypothetical protein